MAFAKKYSVIVDGYSAGNLLAPEFLRRGMATLHVQSTAEIWPVFLPSYRPDDYTAHFTYRGDIDRLVEALHSYDILCVAAGTETGVELADALAERLSLPGNRTDYSAARRNKYLMNESVRESGLPVAMQREVFTSAEAIQFRQSHHLRKVVVKPLNSAGTDSVAVCEDDAAIASAVARIVGKTNMLGIANQSALVQEFLEGTEYFLDTVSFDGDAHFTDIWRYQKRSINGHDCVYDRNILLACDEDPVPALCDYVEGVLRGLRIQWGPAHTEVILTTSGPRLVESGARLDGLSVPAVNSACIGFGPLELTCAAYTDRAAFYRQSSRLYPRLKHASTVYLTSYETGTVIGIPGEHALRSLASFFQLRLRAKVGSKIGLTTDYFTAPGFLTLVHDDPGVIEADYERIRAMECEGRLFEVVAEKTTRQELR